MHHRRAVTLPCALLCAALLLSACGSVPPRGGIGAPDRDGPEANPPPDLEQVPDAVPQVEPIRAGGPNKPYEVAGRVYVPQTEDRPYPDRGLASWYGRKFHGRPTSSGEIYNMYAMTAAHPTWPIPSYARVRNPANGREVIVRVNDRGPFVRGRVLDLSYTAALKLGLLRGVGIVEAARITHDEIRGGAWRRDAAAPEALAQAAPSAPPPRAAPAAPPEPDPPVPAVAAASPQPAPDADGAAPVARAFTDAARGFWVQLGAFRDRGRAVALQAQAGDALQTLAPLLTIFEERSLHRLQAGPYANRDEARGVADQVRGTLQIAPQVLERR